MIVRLKRKHPKYPDLSPRQDYVVIGIEADDLRLLNDHGQPYLYPAALFSVVDGGHPDDWLCEQGDDGETYAYPVELNTPGFFEDYFDHKPEAVTAFWKVVNRQLATAAAG